MAVSRRVELIGAVRAVKRVRVRAVAAMMDERQQQLMRLEYAEFSDKIMLKERIVLE